jgi:hypothetical protein
VGAGDAACFGETGKHAKGSGESCSRAMRAWFLQQRNAPGLSGVCAERMGCLFGQGSNEKAIPQGSTYQGSTYQGSARTSDVSSGPASVVGRSHAAK